MSRRIFIEIHILKAKYDDRFKLYFEPEGILEYAFEDDSQMFQGRLKYTFGIYHPTNRDFLLLEQIEGDLINKVVDLKDEICISFIMGLINTNLKIPQKNIGNKIDIFINYNGQYKELEKRYGNKEPCFEFCDGLPIVGMIVDGKVNFINIAHVGILNAQKPHLISFGIHKSHYSNIGIKANKTFSVNILSKDKIIEMDYVGIVSGKITILRRMIFSSAKL